MLHVAGFGGVIKVEQLISKLRPCHAGAVVDEWPDFAVYPKGWIVLQTQASSNIAWDMVYI